MTNKNKFNAIDFLICLVFLTVLVISVIGLSENSDYYDFLNVFGENPVKITVKSKPLSREYLDKISVGQIVINFENGDEIGKISNIQLYDYETDNDESLFYAVIDIDSTAKAEDNYYSINGEKVLVNKIKNFSVPELYFEGDITSVISSGNGK